MSRIKQVLIAAGALAVAALSAVWFILRLRRQPETSTGEDLAEQGIKDAEKKADEEWERTKDWVRESAAKREQEAAERAVDAGAGDNGDPRGVFERHGANLKS